MSRKPELVCLVEIVEAFSLSEQGMPGATVEGEFGVMTVCNLSKRLID